MLPPRLGAVPTPTPGIRAGDLPPTPPPIPTPTVQDQPPTPSPTPTPTPTPAPTPLPPGTVADRVRVRKQAREMTLFRGSQELRTYRVALGPSPEGHKQFEGDGRTPEGRYHINWRNPKSDFHLSLKISYPNRTDAARARAAGRSPGGEIFIHGLPNGSGAIGAAHRLRDWTAGCVAVTNEEIEEIWRVVPDGCIVDLEP
ncbi:MAG: L,D-transpeptidase family protein [Verrucomicrobia bacterium]|nr:L,D-transpeptidase family protein [Verrucomicrobiota bacterium]